MSLDLFARPALLFLPASNPRAVAKARESAADLVILDLEDAVKPEDKERARDAAVEAVASAWPMPVGIRINAERKLSTFDRRPPAEPSELDCAAVARSEADFVVLPKAETGIDELADRTGKPVLAMIETPYAILFLREMIGHKALAGLIVGTNDLAAELRLPSPAPRLAMSLALQTVICAARIRSIPAWDGVCNQLDDAAGLEAQAHEARAFGFDGKSLIHPDQIAACQAAFAPTATEIARAERLIAAATGGAERFEGAMIEEIHVESARRLLAHR